MTLIPALTALPADGTLPIAISAARIDCCSAVRIKSVATAGSGDVFLAKYEPTDGTWWPYGSNHPMTADSAVNSGRFDGRFAMERTGPVWLVLVGDAAVTLSATAADHQIEALDL